MGAPRQIPMTDKRTFVCVHHSAADEHHFGIDEFFAEFEKRDEGYNMIITEDEGLPVHHPFFRFQHTQVAQEAPNDMISNGVYGLNQLSWNICINGNFELEHPPQDAVDALIQILASKCKAWGWTKQDALHRIITHNEAGRFYAPEGYRYITQCPGKYLIALMSEIRTRVASYLPE
jgi:hypothetical protein